MRNAQARGHARRARERREPNLGRIQSGELMQGHIIQRAADGGIHPLPAGADTALTLDAAPARCAAAFGDGDGPLEYIQDLGRRDILRPARELVAAVGAARRDHHAGALQTFQHLAYGRTVEPCAFGQIRRGAVTRGVLR